MKKGVILLSGGLDSAVTLYAAIKKGYKLTALIFDYGQRHKKEVECAKTIARINKIKYFVEKIDLSWTKSSLTNKNIKVPFKCVGADQCARPFRNKKIPNTYVAGRNIIFLSYAFSLAESVGANNIFIGAHTQDYSGYPDCRPQFLKSFQKAANSGTKHGSIKINTPLINKTKKDIITLGIKLGVPFDLTWSCYKGLEQPCKKCDSCRFRINAFDELGMRDPLLK